MYIYTHMLKLSETKIEKSYTTCSDTDRTNILSICRQTSVEVSLRMHLFYTIKKLHPSRHINCA